MLIVFTILLIKSLCLEGRLFGDHVCQTEIIEPHDVLQWELKNRTVRTYKWCMNVPPRCSEYNHKVFNETKISVINITKSIETCCEGFHEQNSYCISMCQDCKNGLCLKGTCICQSGWDGPNCDSRVLNFSEETTFFVTTSFSSKTILEQSSIPQEPVRQLNNDTAHITSTTHQNPNNHTHYDPFLDRNTIISLSPTTSTSDSPDLKENTVTSTNLYSLSTILTQDSSQTLTSSISKEEQMLNQSKEKLSSEDSEELITEFNLLNYLKKHERKNSEEESMHQYSTESVIFDTTVTQPALARSTVLNKEERTNYTTKQYFKNEVIATTIIIPKYTDVMLENLDSDIDYRELGGQSFEENSMESPKVVQNGVNENGINLNVLEAISKNPSFPKNFENNIEKSTAQNMPGNVAPVLEKPNIVKDDSKNSVSKEDSQDASAGLSEEKYQKRYFNRDYSQNTVLTKNEHDNNNLIYSVCAASATTVLILIVAIIAFTFRNTKNKIDKNKDKKDVAVAVYTTSIFHTPLPDPPTFENPTYLSTGGGNESWNDPSEEIIEVQEFNVMFQKPLKNPKLDCHQYLYDHPPSTGSYRASSEIDTLSQYNLSHKSVSGIILEPVYDEIPSRDIPVESSNEHTFVHRSSVDDAPRNNLNYVDNNSLYVNTLGRTMF